MACGCKKGIAHKNRTPIIRPITSQRSIQRGIAAAKTPTEARNASMTPQQPSNPAGITAEKRKTQALRRDAIRKALNK